MNTTTEHEAVTEQGRAIFRATMAKTQALISERGVSPEAVVAGLLAVVTEVAVAAMGPAETARTLRIAALGLEETVS